MPGTQLSIKNCYHSYHKLGCLARFSCARVNTSLVSFPDTLTLSLIYCMTGKHANYPTMASGCDCLFFTFIPSHL